MKLTPLFHDFCVFARAHVTSGDIDPTYPVLRAIYEAQGWDEERRLWATFLYVTFYHLGSAEMLWKRWPYPRVFDGDDMTKLALPTGTERRSFRGNPRATAVHINALATEAARAGGLWAWVQDAVGMGGEAGWDNARARFAALPFGGSWSSYKWADLLKNVHGAPITASDIGVGGGSATAGPIPGMVALTGADWRECACNVHLQKALLHVTCKAGVPLGGLDQLETALCDFNSLLKGRYYVGHDIDDQQGKLRSINAGPEWWRARLKSYAPKYLGEINGWTGVRSALRRVYADTKEVWLP